MRTFREHLNLHVDALWIQSACSLNGNVYLFIGPIISKFGHSQHFELQSETMNILINYFWRYGVAFLLLFHIY